MFGKLISERLARANLTAQCRPFSSDECELAIGIGGSFMCEHPPLWKYSRSYSYTLGILCPTSATHYVDVSLSHTRDSYSAHSAPCEHARTNRMRSERDTIGADSCSSRARGWGRLIRAGDPGETFSLRRLIIPTRRLLHREPSPRMVQKVWIASRSRVAKLARITSAVSRARCQSSRSSSAAASQSGTISQRPQAEELCGALRPCSQEPQRVRPRAASLPS